MAAHTTDGTDEGHLDLVPMIDCIMLLLLFFMMTTKFSAEEKSINSLLPTNQGPAEKKQIEPPPTITESIYPAGITSGYQPSEYARQLATLHQPGQVIGDAYLRIGNRDPLLISGSLLTGRDTSHPQAMPELIDRIHTYVADELTKFEKAGEPRNHQPDILISCFSGLSWKFGLIAYDGIRAYEGVRGKITYSGNPEQLLAARAVTFVPPRMRDYTANDLGEELYEIVHHH